MKNRKNAQREAHPAHPVRNLFYTLWMLLAALCFAGMFLALACEGMPYRLPLMIGCGAVTAVTLAFGLVAPLFHR